MSVIFGIVEEDKIIIAGDKRTSREDGTVISDEKPKVFVINEKLAVATAGNVSIETAILMEIKNQSSKSNLNTDDLVMIIDGFYKKIMDNKATTIFAFPFYCLIAGMGSDGKSHLVNAGKFKNGFGANEVPMALYPPADTNQDNCNQIFVKNYKLHHENFCERTIHEISDISNVVSPNGSKWVYEINNKKGVMYDF